MGNHRVASAGPRADQGATVATGPHFEYATETTAPH